MARIAKADVNTALEIAAMRIRDAGGADGRISKADMTKALKTLTGTEKKLTDVFFKFLDHRDFKSGAQVTVSDLDRGVAYAKEKLIAKYDLNKNGFSDDEVKKMKLTGKLSVELAKELKAAAAARTAIDEGSFWEFKEKVTISSTTDLTIDSDIDELLSQQILAAVHQSTHTDVTDMAGAFDAVDQGEIVVTEAKDKKTGQLYTAIDYGAGDNTYGAIFLKGEAAPIKGIQDGDLYAPELGG